MSTLALGLAFALAVAAMTAAATAVRSASRIWLRHWAERQITGSGAEGVPTVARPQRLLLAAGTGIASVAFALGAFVAFREDRAGLVRHLLMLAAALLVIGQLAPRAIARRWAPRVLPLLLPLLRGLDLLFGPILAFAGRVVRPFLTRYQPPADPDPGDALEDLLREAEAEGIGEAAESEIISGVAEFGEKRVRDVMRLLERVTSVSTSTPAADVAQLVARSNYTRIPVFGPGPADVAGVLHAFDVLVQPDAPLANLRPATFAAIDEPAGALMRRMMRDRRHLAVVRDGDAVAGIVTLEDLVEELVGDIRDEHDEPGASA